MSFGQARYADINVLLNRRFSQHPVLICAHRGSWHGNVIQNTLIAYKAALMQGADILETDTTATTDQVVLSLHDGVERQMFRIGTNAYDMTAAEVQALHPYNAVGEPSSHHVGRLDDILAALCHDELINIDRSWRARGLLLPLLDRHPHMVRQAIVKAPLRYRELFEALGRHPVKYMFMPICYSLKEVDEALSYPGLNTVGVELIAKTPQDELCSEAAVRYIHDRGLYCWVNALTLTDIDTRSVLYGGLDDDTSILQGPAAGWGKLMDMGIDVIHTDWPALVKDYREARFHS